MGDVEISKSASESWVAGKFAATPGAVRCVPGMREPWIDHLRAAMIVLVVNMHACVTYTHVGDWYIKSTREPELSAKVPYILWQGHLQAFFMGLLFFLAGHFAERSLTRKGRAGFLRERLWRLGIPTLLYILVIHPFIVLGLNPWNAKFGPKLTWYWQFLTSGRFIGESGPMWFAFALLIFCVVFALWPRSARSASAAEGEGESRAGPSGFALLAFGLVLVVATFLVRTVQPIGTDVINFQFCFFAQYIGAFVVGIFSARGDWLRSLAETKLARRAGWIGAFAGPIAMIAIMVFGGPPADDERPYSGGWFWQAGAMAAWEQFAGLGLALGVMSFFVRRVNRESTAWRWLSDRAFGVYLLHTPVLIALTMAMRPLEASLPVPALIAILTGLGLAGSLLVADLARRVPGLRSVL